MRISRSAGPIKKVGTGTSVCYYQGGGCVIISEGRSNVEKER